ncbi:MAG: hypothetical protein QM487_12300 [Candidatus Marithrix sp.]
MIEVTGAGSSSCPELNPIEYIWAKKNFIKKTIISNTEGLYQTIADALETILMMHKILSITVYEIVPYISGKHYKVHDAIAYAPYQIVILYGLRV